MTKATKSHLVMFYVVIQKKCVHVSRMGYSPFVRTLYCLGDHGGYFVPWDHQGGGVMFCLSIHPNFVCMDDCLLSDLTLIPV